MKQLLTLFAILSFGICQAQTDVYGNYIYHGDADYVGSTKAIKMDSGNHVTFRGRNNQKEGNIFYAYTGDSGLVINTNQRIFFTSSTGAFVWELPPNQPDVGQALIFDTTIGGFIARTKWGTPNGSQYWQVQGSALVNTMKNKNLSYTYSPNDSDAAALLGVGNLVGLGLPDSSTILGGSYSFFPSPVNIFGSTSLPIYTVQIGDDMTPSSLYYNDGSSNPKGMVLVSDSFHGAHWSADAGTLQGVTDAGNTTTNSIFITDRIGTTTGLFNVRRAASGNTASNLQVIELDSNGVEVSDNYLSPRGLTYTDSIGNSSTIAWQHILGITTSDTLPLKSGTIALQTESGATGSEPSTPYLGQFYFDATLVKMKFWNGTAWAVITSTP